MACVGGTDRQVLEMQSIHPRSHTQSVLENLRGKLHTLSVYSKFVVFSSDFTLPHSPQILYSIQ